MTMTSSSRTWAVFEVTGDNRAVDTEVTSDDVHRIVALQAGDSLLLCDLIRPHYLTIIQFCLKGHQGSLSSGE